MDENQQYNLRDRNTLNPPSRYLTTSQEEINLNQRIKWLCQQCDAKRRSILKRVDKINSVINSLGSRTRLLMLRSHLQKVRQETLEIHTQLGLLPSYDDNSYGPDWIEDLTIIVDSCCVNVEEYLVERQNDPPSRSMSEYEFEGSEVETLSVRSAEGHLRHKYVQEWQKEYMKFREIAAKMKNLSMQEDQNVMPQHEIHSTECEVQPTESIILPGDLYPQTSFQAQANHTDMVIEANQRDTQTTIKDHTIDQLPVSVEISHEILVTLIYLIIGCELDYQLSEIMISTTLFCYLG